MVEKLLETATLDSEALQFNFKKVDVPQMLAMLVERYKDNILKKTFWLILPKPLVQLMQIRFIYRIALTIC